MKRTLGLFVLTFALLQGATGCIYSEDREVIESTYLHPKTVTVIYKPSNKTAWTYDIPPGHMLVVERDATTGNAEFIRADPGNPTKLMWELYGIDATPSIFRKDHYSSTAIETGEMALEGGPVIVTWTLRDPIDPATVPQDRQIEDIEQDLTDTEGASGTGDDDLPEPDAPAE